MDLISLLTEPARRAGLEVRSLVALFEAGVVGVELPHNVLRMVSSLNDFGPLGAAAKIAAIRHGKYTAIADERGEITYAELDKQTDQLTNALSARLQPGDTIGILCRNHRSPLIAAFAASRAGLNCVWLNTGFSARQATEVATREGVDLLIYDADLSDVVADFDPPHGKFACAIDAPADEFTALVSTGSTKTPSAPKKPGRIILLTSGTTGTPKGAPRAEPRGLTVPGAVLERMPMKARQTVIIGPPMFHGTGLLITLLAIALGSRLVLRRKFDAAQLADDIETFGASTVCLVPVMLQRLLALGPDELGRRDLSSLRVIFCAGSQLPAQVGTEAQRVLGDVIYNLYGSTEVALATMATPKDVHEAPTSVGKPMLGSRIKILDEQGKEVRQGEKGRIFVGTTIPFEGYTGGGNKEIIDGLLSTGDVGHFDKAGRLYIDGRDDEMIVSGGENVFPREIEELLVTHPAIADAAAIGVDDPDFGKRLRTFVVVRPGASITVDEVKDFVKNNLARYKTPRDVLFLDELPRNPTGKILKRELAERA
ncbi:AMP-binding protein [Smaragdicoccus niigatensis]|uniref:AMP-binding protein n=1 Tax=Smaragdicoccus niigatensis TaxID=359359 RepID=UPI00037450FB|nr:AMP-binding protein [Smaragdicoccus niigatensis]